MAGAGVRMWQVSAWGDPWFELLDSAHKVTFMYLVLGPNSRPSGLFVQSLRQMALALNTQTERVEAIMADFERDGKVYRDDDVGLVWVVNMLAVNQRMGMGPPVLRSIEQDVEKFAHSPLVAMFLAHYPTVEQPSRSTLTPTLTQGLTNPSKHKQEQEHRTKEPSKPRPSRARTRTSRAPDPLWDALVAALDLDPEGITSNRRGKLNAALKQLREVDASPDEIPRRVNRYRRLHPDWALTETSLATHWAELAPAKRRQPIEDVVDEPAPSREETAAGLAAIRGVLGR